MTADREGKHDPKLDLRIGRSWCCRALVVQVDDHWQCMECGKANASDTNHRAAPVRTKTEPLSKDAKYIGELMKEAA